MSLADAVLPHIDIVSLVSKYVSMKRAGSNYLGLCPFHNEKSPSFLVSPSKQIYKCFGCGKGGNAINFFMEIERMEYKEAIKQLADDHKIALPQFTGSTIDYQAQKSEKEKHLYLTKCLYEYFVTSLSRSVSTLDYLISTRKLSSTHIQTFGLGYCSSSVSDMTSFITSKGFTTDDLIQYNYLKKSERGDIYMFFRDRLMIPIRNTFGQIIAFGARALMAGQEPKYFNSSQSDIYDKSSVLYGIDHLKQGVKEHKCAILVEGYFDVIALSVAGYQVGVASCGTSFTPEHCTQLKRYTDDILFLFDADTAGQLAAYRGLQIARAKSIRPRIMSLPTGYKDIDEYCVAHPGQDVVKGLIDIAQDGFAWLMLYITRTHDLTRPVERAKALYMLFDCVYTVQSIAMQTDILMQASHVFGIDHTVLIQQYRQYIKSDKKVYTREEKPSIYTINKQGLREAIIDPVYNTKHELSGYPWMSVIHDIYTACMTHSEGAYILDEMSLRWDKELDDILDTPKKLATIRSILSVYICEQLAIYRKSATTPEQIAQAMVWDRAVKMG